METIQITTADYLTRAARKAAELGGIGLLIAAFVLPLLVLPFLTVSYFPEMVQIMNAAGSSSSEISMTIVVVMSFLGFAASLLSVAYVITQSRSEDAHQPLPVASLIFQNLCLLATCSILFLR